MMDGTKVTTRAQWVCRHREISAMVQHYETGPKEVKEATVAGSFSGDKLTVNVSGGEQDVSFTVSISLPSTGTAPYPALIQLAGSLNNTRMKQLGVAVIDFQHNGVQPEGNRNGGIFAKFHGNPGSGSLIAWAWGASRLIDALESTPDAKIDPKRLAVTGCSRNGKGALMVGAMDSRIALTIPQESGSGGVAAWRVSEVDNMGRTGSAGVQNLTRTYGETQWFSTAIEQFGNSVTKLPIDHHELVGMVAPRGLLILGNVNYEWLSTNNADQAGGAARLIYEALGVKQNIGYVDSGHNHCGTDYAGGEQDAIDSFVKKFLLHDATANTDVWKPKYELDKGEWVDWTAPMLP
ncbi:dockerin-like protein [Sorangium sp. So ce1128]